MAVQRFTAVVVLLVVRRVLPSVSLSGLGMVLDWWHTQRGVAQRFCKRRNGEKKGSCVAARSSDVFFFFLLPQPRDSD